VSETPSVGLAIPLAAYGTELGAPFFPPFGAAVGGITGAVIGGMTGEGLQYGTEKASGLPQAEPGTFWQRVGSAGVRTGTGEVISNIPRAGAQYVYGAVRPAAEAAQELRPILSGAVTGAVPAEGEAAHVAMEPQQVLARWYQENVLGKPPAEAVQAWDTLGKVPGAQEQVAGEHLGAMNDYMATLRAGSTPWSQSISGVTKGAAPTAAYALWTGHPYAATTLFVPPAARDLAAEAGRKLLSAGLRSPRLGVPFLANLPPIAQVAGPLFDWGSRLGGQGFAAENWPPAASIPAGPIE
jgi:hypothetical protein